MGKEEVDRRWQEAVRHMEFCAYVYQFQHRNNRYFLHEHPHGATSWKLPAMQQLLNLPGVIRTRSHM
eukprot:12182981-Karenia_brevis.AAC.1